MGRISGRTLIVGAFVLGLGSHPIVAQLADFKVAGRDIVMHGFLSQGYMKSDGNNFITATTGSGTFRMTEGALNIATKLTDRLHVGAQVYDRNIGRLGRGKPQVDWAFADYRIKDWLGFRGGKVKTPLGLYNDTQDMEFLHPWALLPQSVYPTDLRSVTIAHTGGDVYGRIDVGWAGAVSYQAYGGVRPVDRESGFIYGLRDQGFSDPTYAGINAGFDLRWSTPIKGLRAGASYIYSPFHIDTMLRSLPVAADADDRQYAGYGEYRRGGWTLAAEYRENPRTTPVTLGGRKLPDRIAQHTSYFASAAYRFRPWLQLGTYNSRFHFVANTVPGILAGADTYIHDQVATARFDFLKHWTFKIEGHFMEGVGSPISAHGFYVSDNPRGLKPRTNLLVFRLGFNL